MFPSPITSFREGCKSWLRRKNKRENGPPSLPLWSYKYFRMFLAKRALLCRVHIAHCFSALFSLFLCLVARRFHFIFVIFFLRNACFLLYFAFSLSFLPFCRLLTYSLQDDKVRSQDSVAVIDSVAINPKGRIIAWEFVKKNYPLLFKR